jgi:Ca2+-binding EF-hand superfamily protein
MADKFVSVDMEQERMRTAFQVIDKNGDGKISLQEFRAVMLFNDMFTKDETDKLFRKIDSGGKGYLDYNGKYSLMNSSKFRINVITVYF